MFYALIVAIKPKKQSKINVIQVIIFAINVHKLKRTIKPNDFLNL